MKTAPVKTAPGALPLLGHSHLLLRNAPAFLDGLRDVGDLVEIRLGARRVYVPTTAALGREILLDSHHAFDKGGPFFESVTTYFGSGLATCPNAVHPRMRRILQPAFSPQLIEEYSHVAVRETRALTRTWASGQRLDIYRAAQLLMARITIGTLLPDWLTDEDGLTRAVTDIDTFFKGAILRTAFPLIGRLPLAGHTPFIRARSRLYDRVNGTIARYRQQPTGAGVLRVLLTPETEGELSDTERRDQIITLFMAGIGTSAAVVSWALHYIARDPRLADRLYQEIAEVAPGRPVVHDDLPALSLVTNTVAETLRVKPVAWIASRTVTAPTYLGTHPLPVGASVIMSPHIYHHDPALFPDPHRFDPDRWHTTSTHNPAYLPFGAGPRQCIANTFALTTIPLVLANLLGSHKVARAKDPTPAARVVLEPKHLTLLLHRYDASAYTGKTA